jgi:hypothetical protein
VIAGASIIFLLEKKLRERRNKSKKLYEERED